jgi:large subunit ribosomal protein L6
MARIGKKPIKIPQGVEINIKGQTLEIKGSKGNISLKFLSGIKVEIDQDNLYIKTLDDDKQTIMNQGTMHSLIANAIKGVSEGFSKVLEIEGVGYRATMDGDNLILNVGFSHPVRVSPLEGIKISTEKNQIIISGINKEKVGEMAAKIRAIRKPEPYKGKGIRYQGEIIKRKVGKKVAAVGGTQNK